MKALVVICAALFALSTQTASACTSINSDFARKYADIIFVGTPKRVLSPTGDRSSALVVNREQISEIQFEIRQIIKGYALETVTIWSIDGSGYCSALWPMKKLNPSASGDYLIYAWKDKISGNYKTSASYPNERTIPQIDPRFPSGSWTLRPNNRGWACYWLRMKDSQFHQRIRAYVSYSIGSILRQGDSVASRIR